MAQLYIHENLQPQTHSSQQVTQGKASAETGPIYRGLHQMETTLTPTIQYPNFTSDYQGPQMVTSIDSTSREPAQLLKMKHQSTTTIIQANKIQADKNRVGGGQPNHLECPTSNRTMGMDRSMTSQAINSPHIFQNPREISIYQPQISNTNSDYQSTQNPPQQLESSRTAYCLQANNLVHQNNTSRNKNAAQVATGFERCNTGDEVMSMSSFVPSVHPPLSNSRIGSGQVSYKQLPHHISSIEQQRQPPLDGATSARKQNLQNLDKNFNQLMEQNQRLEREIRDMNDQFTLKQNQRLALVAAENQKSKSVVAKILSDESNVSNTFQNQQTRASQPNTIEQDDKAVLQSSFDKRCQRTKEIVTELAQRLHNAKRETFTELDRIQTRKSRAADGGNHPPMSTSNSNSRSPDGIAVANNNNQHSRNRRLMTSSGQPNGTRESETFGKPEVNIQRVQYEQNENQKSQERQSRESLQRDNGVSYLNNSNLEDAQKIEKRPIIKRLTSPTNSGGGGAFNFRQLKPTDSIHTSMNELSVIHKSPESQTKKSKEVSKEISKETTQQQQQLCFDNSPMRKSQHQQTRVLSQDSTENQPNSNQAAQAAAASRNYKRSTSRENETQNNHQQQQQQKQQQQQQQIQQPQILQQQPRELVVDNNSQEVNPDNSPLNVNGAAQLSNILQQINSTGGAIQNQNNNNKEVSNMPRQVQQLAHANLFISSDSQNFVKPQHTGILTTEHTPTNALISPHQRLQLQTSEKRAYALQAPSPIHSDETFNHMKVLQLQQQQPTQQQILSQQDSQTNGFVDHLAVDQQQRSFGLPTQSDCPMSYQTFDKMHIEIVQLQDKIRNLEAQMITSPSAATEQVMCMNGLATTTSGNVGQKTGVSNHTLQGTIQSDTSVPYQQDSKHMKDSSRLSMVKMTVPKTVLVQPVVEKQLSSRTAAGVMQSGDSCVNMASAKQNKNDEKKLIGKDHKDINNNSSTIYAAVSHRQNQSQKDISSIQENSQIQESRLHEHHKKHSVDNLLVTSREKNEMTPLQREMSDLMSQSQPEMVNSKSRRKRSSQISAKSINRVTSKRSVSAKSELSKSQRSKGRKSTSNIEERSNRAERKIKNKSNLSSSHSILVENRCKKVKSKERGNNHSSKKEKSLVVNSTGALSTQQQLDEIKETRFQRNEKSQSFLTVPYMATTSEYTVPGELIFKNHKDDDRQNVIISQVESPMVIMENTSIQNSQSKVNNHNNHNNHNNQQHQQQQQQPDKQNHTTSVANGFNESFSENATNSFISNNNLSTLRKQQQNYYQQKQQKVVAEEKQQKSETFPLRVRKNQSAFVKGTECGSIKSSIAGLHEIDMDQTPREGEPGCSDDAMDAEALDCTSNNSRALLMDNSELRDGTIQIDIVREYENQIIKNEQGNKVCDHVKSSRNTTYDPTDQQQQMQQHESHQSEISQVKNAFEEDLMNGRARQQKNLALGQTGSQDNCQKNLSGLLGGNWTNQTSRFQLNDQDPNSSAKMLQSVKEQAEVDGQIHFTYKRGKDDARERSGEAQGDDADRNTPYLDDQEQSQGDCDEYEEANTTTDAGEDSAILDQKPLTPRNLEEAEKIAVKKAKLNRDLPLQQQRSMPTTMSASTLNAHAQEKSRINFLEQRNRHLELELKRHKVHLAQQDELNQKYKCLKIDYKQIMQSFERSEDIRREQKELISEQRLQMKNLKAKQKKQDAKMADVLRELEDARFLTEANNNQRHTNVSQTMLDLSKVSGTSHSQSMRNSKQFRGSTSQPAGSNGVYRSRSNSYSRSRSRSDSRQSQNSHSQVSYNQMSRSQFNNPKQQSKQNLQQQYLEQQQFDVNMSYGQPMVGADMPRQMHISQQQQKQSSASQQMIGSYQGTGMLDIVNGSGSDLVMPVDGYSVVFEQERLVDQGKPHHNSLRDSKSHKHKKQTQRSTTPDSSKLRKRKKSHKKSKHGKHRRNNQHSATKKSDRSRSASACSKRSQRSMSHSKNHSSKHRHQQPQNPHDFNQSYHSVNTTFANNSKPPKMTQQRHKSSKKRSKKDRDNQPGYIFNIQTSATEIMKGVHKYQSSKNSITDIQNSSHRHGSSSHNGGNNNIRQHSQKQKRTSTSRNGNKLLNESSAAAPVFKI